MKKPRFEIGKTVRIIWRDVGDVELHEMSGRVKEVTEQLVILDNGLRFQARSGMLLTSLWIKPEAK